MLGYDGDCEDGSKWYYIGTTGSLNNTYKASGSSSIKIVASNSNSEHYADIHLNNFETNSKYFVSTYLSCHSGVATLFGIVWNDSGSPTYGGFSGAEVMAGNTKRVGQIINVTGPTNGYGLVRAYALNNSKQGVYVGNNESVSFDGFMVIKLKPEDEGLSVDQLLEKYPYVNGTKLVSGTRIKSISKNLLDYTKTEVGAMDWITGLNIQTGDACRRTNYIAVTGNAIFAGVAATGLVDERLYEYDSEKNFIKMTYIPNVNMSINLDSKTRYIKVYWANTSTIPLERLSNTFITLGSSVSNFEEYKESAIYLPGDVEFKSLPNGIRDEFIIDKNEYIKNTGKSPLDSSHAWEGFNNNQFTTITYASIPNWGSLNNAICGNTNLICSNKDIVFASVIYFADDGRPQVGLSPDGRLWVAIPKNKLGGSTGYSNDLSGFIKYISDNKTELIYPLDKPQTSKLNTSPLIAYPNGTIIVEPAVKNANSYTATGIIVQNKELPIKFIEAIYKLDGSLMSPIDMSKVHIASNGLSFTIDGAKPGEDYEYVYQYDQSLTTLPTIKYSVPTNQAAQIEGNTDMIELLTKKIELLEERLKAIESDRAVQYEYDSNGRLIRRLKN